MLWSMGMGVVRSTMVYQEIPIHAHGFASSIHEPNSSDSNTSSPHISNANRTDGQDEMIFQSYIDRLISDEDNTQIHNHWLTQAQFFPNPNSPASSSNNPFFPPSPDPQLFHMLTLLPQTLNPQMKLLITPRMNGPPSRPQPAERRPIVPT